MNLSIERQIESVKAFLPEDQEIERIIKICNLIPYNSWMNWIDAYGNSLNIKKDKNVLSNKETLNKSFKIKDIYHKAFPLTISNKSKFALISFAESIKTAANICFILFLGNDNKLRTLSFIKNEWMENQLPLTVGITTLRSLVKNLNVENYAIINSRNIKLPYNCNVIKSWASIWPLTNTLILDMMLTNQLLTRKILADLRILKET